MIPILSFLRRILHSLSLYLHSLFRFLLTFKSYASLERTNSSLLSNLQSFSSDNEKLREGAALLESRIHLLEQSLSTAQSSATTAISRAEQFHQLYLSEVESHKTTLREHTNWFALSTSNRIKVHPSAGPDLPPAPIDNDEALPPSPSGPIRASVLARHLSAENLRRLSQEESTLRTNIERQMGTAGPILPDPVPSFDDALKSLNRWWTEANPGIPLPTDHDRHDSMEDKPQ